jgi:hypothetical protein
MFKFVTTPLFRFHKSTLLSAMITGEYIVMDFVNAATLDNVEFLSLGPGDRWDIYFQDSPPPHEFRTIDDFRDYWIRRSLRTTKHTTTVNERIVLTHGDLSSRNILVKDGVIIAVVDRETFGWYPSFWEYTFVYRGAWNRSYRGLRRFTLPLAKGLSITLSFKLSAVGFDFPTVLQALVADITTLLTRIIE